MAVRKSTLSSGEVTVICQSGSHRSVTTVFCPPSPSTVLWTEGPQGSSKTLESRSDTQLRFSIEALKIAKRARDLREKERTRARSGRSFLHQLRKIRSLPNLRVIKNLRMIRSLSRSRLEDLEEDRSSLEERRLLEGDFGCHPWRRGRCYLWDQGGNPRPLVAILVSLFTDLIQ